MDQKTQDKAQTKRLALKRIEGLSSDSEWNLLQQILQEIEATLITKGEKKYGNEYLGKLLKEEVKERYQVDKDLTATLLEAIPSRYSIANWRAKKGWSEAVWNGIRTCGLFTKEKRAQMMEAVFNRGINRSDNAAKLWLTLSGDYVEKGENKSDVLDLFREINNEIHKKSS